jgi:hypothetical protein
MAKMHSANALYSGRPGGLDIEWPRGAYFHMSAVLPWDISAATFVGGLRDKQGVALADITISGTVYGTTSGLLDCSMSEAITLALPDVSDWYIDQIENSHTYPKLAGTFTILEKGEA